MAKAGFGSLIAPGLIKIGVFMILAPLIGLALGFGLMLATVWTFRSVTSPWVATRWLIPPPTRSQTFSYCHSFRSLKGPSRISRSVP